MEPSGWGGIGGGTSVNSSVASHDMKNVSSSQTAALIEFVDVMRGGGIERGDFEAN